MFEKCEQLNINNQTLNDAIVNAPNIEDMNDDAVIKKCREKTVYDKVMMADFECFTTTGKLITQAITHQDGTVTEIETLERMAHEEYLLCYCDETSVVMHGRNIFSLLDYLKCTYECATEDVNVLCYFHNLGYDSSYIMFKNIELSNPLKFNGKIISLNATIRYEDGRKITIRF